MKVFWISLFLFVLLLCGIAVNAYFICRSVDAMQSSLSAMDEPTRRHAELHRLQSFWKKHRNQIEFTVGIKEITRIDTLLTELEWILSEGSEQAFQKQKALLLAALTDLKQQELPGLHSIF